MKVNHDIKNYKTEYISQSFDIIKRAIDNYKNKCNSTYRISLIITLDNPEELLQQLDIERQNNNEVNNKQPIIIIDSILASKKIHKRNVRTSKYT